MKKALGFLFCCALCLSPVFAEVYEDMARATSGTVTHLSRENAKDFSKQESRTNHFYPSASIKQLPNFSSHQSKWALQKLKLKVLSTGTIGGHAGWAYNKYSFEKMAKILSPKDVPGLLELFSTEEGSTIGIQFALASQCRAGLEEVMRSLEDKTFHKLNANSVDTYVASEIIQHISNFNRCDNATREEAKKALIILQGKYSHSLF